MEEKIACSIEDKFADLAIIERDLEAHRRAKLVELAQEYNEKNKKNPEYLIPSKDFEPTERLIFALWMRRLFVGPLGFGVVIDEKISNFLNTAEIAPTWQALGQDIENLFNLDEHPVWVFFNNPDKVRSALLVHYSLKYREAIHEGLTPIDARKNIFPVISLFKLLLSASLFCRITEKNLGPVVVGDTDPLTAAHIKMVENFIKELPNTTLSPIEWLAMVCQTIYESDLDCPSLYYSITGKIILSPNPLDWNLDKEPVFSLDRHFMLGDLKRIMFSPEFDVNLDPIKDFIRQNIPDQQ